jgi:hypothetical protein
MRIPQSIVLCLCLLELLKPIENNRFFWHSPGSELYPSMVMPLSNGLGQQKGPTFLLWL